jgi:hypothetical protein
METHLELGETGQLGVKESGLILILADIHFNQIVPGCGCFSSSGGGQTALLVLEE